jgi:archaellum component FlaC
MTTVTESDIKEIKDFLVNLDKKIDVIDKKLDIHIARTDEKLKAIDERFDQLDKRIDDVNKRVDSVDARLNTFMLGFLSIVGIMATGMLGIVGKVVFFPNP